MRFFVLIAVLLILIIPVGAEEVQHIEVSPGMIQAASPIYFLDNAEDEFSIMIGLRTRGDVAHEKASEMVVAQARNQSKATVRAEKRLNETVQKATNKSYTGLKKAENVLRMLQDSQQDEADKGLSTAIESIQKAQKRQYKSGGLFKEIPNLRSNRSKRVGQLPDVVKTDR